MINLLLDNGQTRIYGLELPETSHRNIRRKAESLAVAQLTRHIFGNSAIYSHLPHGAPCVSPNHSNLSISVSHGASMAIIAVSSLHTVGVDIEAPRQQLIRVAPKFADKNSGSYLYSLLQQWTAKEAVYKAAMTPGLALTEITLSGNTATARGTTYRITHICEPHFTIALAEPVTGLC